MSIKTYVILCFILLPLAACNNNSQELSTQGLAQPLSLVNGQKLFAKKCALCHGRGAKGTNQGPPFIHKIYEPNHHGDQAFYHAAEKGVRAHHWKFGDMPPVKNISKSEMTEIINYIRHEQRKAGIN